MKEAYDNSDKVPLVFNLRDGVIDLSLEEFPFTFRFGVNFSYITTSLVPDFITNHSEVCSFKAGRRPPCWTSDGKVAPSCFVEHFEGECIKQGAPASACDSAIGSVLATLMPGKTGDMCCRDITLNGLKFPKISTLCYDTQQQFTGTFRKNEASCPAGLIENGFQKTLLEWHLF